MSKTNFASAVGASLNGRSNAKATTEAPDKRSASADSAKETKSKESTKEKTKKSSTGREGIPKKSNAGRKKIAKAAKRRNFSLSLDPRTIKKIEEHVAKSGRVRKATYYVSQYLEDHLDEFIDKI